MTSKKLIVLALATAMVAVSACADYQNRPKQTGGALIGAAAGGLAGSQIGGGSGQLAATAVGVLLGGLVGSEVGRSMDEVDRLRAQQAGVQALETGQPIRWENAESGNYGTVTPVRTGTDTQTGALCREYQSTVTVGGKQEQAYGTACQQADGSWKIVN
ncbi:MAG: RT0821/Lpp0805 family surface protein [Rhodospirillales bacterium]|nr:RT0821/Lpp0805 family surface protein [Rhodospirillales bacterium]